MPHINDATKAVNFRKERDANRGAANEAAVHSKYYNKGNTCPSFSFGVPLNDCVNDLSNLQYPRGRVGVDKDQTCQRILTEKQHGATVEPPILAKKLTSLHVNNYSQYSQSLMRSSFNQQDFFFEYQNCKLFLDKATLIGYNGSNMPFIFFRNRINALMDVFPFKNSHLTLLGCSCVGLAGQTIANIVADRPGLSENQRIDICLERLSQRFGVRGGFFAEPQIRKYCYGAKLPSASSFVLKEFKDQLSQCLLYARAYNQSDKLEGRFVVDLAKRLPFFTRQDFLKHLSSRFGHINEPSFQSLFEFVSYEEECKSSDFGILLLRDGGDARGAIESF